jgi:ubiquinone/menaquinone biosynthesis C-methylase UbiE
VHLAGPPLGYGSEVAGLFGLVGVAGVAAAPLVGRAGDRGGLRRTVGLGIGVTALSFVVFGLGGHLLWVLVAGVVLLDLGVQVVHVANQTRNYALRPDARSRLNTVYMVAYFTGGVVGSSLGATGWAVAGWAGVCAVGVLLPALAFGAFLRGAVVSNKAEEQRRLILDQFTRQAVPFAQMPAHSNDEANRLLIDLAGVGPEDTVLDVACGPGLVACTLAGVARHVTGIDLTPAMIEQARARQQSRGLTNLTWLVGDAVPLPFPTAAFSVVVTRYSVHHFLDPRAVLAEMVRVCSPGGRVAVIDVFTSSPEQAEAYNRVEKLRDPSHVRALSLGELTALVHDAGLRNVQTAFFKLELALESLLAASFPNPGDADRIRQTFADDIGVDRLGVSAHRRDGAIHFAFPIVAIVGKQPVKESEHEQPLQGF